MIREPLLVVSPWFEQRRATYQDALLDLGRAGDWDAWIAFFAEGIATSATESGRKVERLVALQRELRLRVERAGKRGAAERLAGDLIGLPYVRSTFVASRYGLSRQGAINAIRALVDIGVLEPVEDFTIDRAQIFRARDVVQVLED